MQVLLLMKNLTLNLSSPDFVPVVSYFAELKVIQRDKISWYIIVTIIEL